MSCSTWLLDPKLGFSGRAAGVLAIEPFLQSHFENPHFFWSLNENTNKDLFYSCLVTISVLLQFKEFCMLITNKKNKLQKLNSYQIPLNFFQLMCIFINCKLLWRENPIWHFFVSCLWYLYQILQTVEF